MVTSCSGFHNGRKISRCRRGLGRAVKTRAAVIIDPRTATPCRTVAFSSDGRTLAEANYLGFVTLRDAGTAEVVRRFLAQTALVETVRFERGTGYLLLVGAGFEGGRDMGVCKVIDPLTGLRRAELRGH